MRGVADEVLVVGGCSWIVCAVARDLQWLS